MPKYEDYVLQGTMTPPSVDPEPATPAEPPAAPAAAPAAPTEPSPQEQLAQLRRERDELAAKLTTLSAGTRAQQAKLVELESQVQAIASSAARQPAQQAPDPREVVQAFDAKIEEVESLLAEAEANDPSKAPALRRELRALERRYSSYVTEQRLGMLQAPDPEALIDMSAKQAKQAMEYENTRSRILEDFPMLDGDSPTANVEMIEAVYDLYHPLIKGGVEPSKALSKAVKLVAKEYGVEKAGKLADLTPPPAKEPAKEPEKPTAAAAARKQEAVERNIRDAANTPPDMGSVGSSNEATTVLGKYNFQTMSIDEFMRIPEADQARIEEALRRYEG